MSSLVARDPNVKSRIGSPGASRTMTNVTIEMPITRAVYQILFEDKDVIEAISDLMSRSPKPEAI